jgi:undecaprenyl-diphosphatase
VERTQQTTSSRPNRSIAIIGLGLVVLIVAALLVRTPPAAWEEGVFRFLNRLPHSVEWVLWVLQQMGSAIVMPFAALVLWRISRRWQPPVALVTAGFVLGWLGAKVVKALVGRGRPGAIFDDVILGFDVPIAEVGFPSGHAVLAFTLAVAFAPYLNRRGRIIAFGTATLVALTRVYVGAHLPLDVVGGAGYGISIGVISILAARFLSAGLARKRSAASAPTIVSEPQPLSPIT